MPGSRAHSLERRDVKRTPLPKFQLFIVLLIQFAEPVTATVIYPFINQFILETGITDGDEKKTGYYAGVIQSTFFFAEAFTVFGWGRASDYLGRRPVLLLGPIGLALAMMCFGLSSTFWSLVASRCMQGIFNGTIGVSKSVMGELTDSTNMGDAFALIPLMWSVGSAIGPVLGGVFSRPATRWPDTLGRISFFHEYPYFLPCAIAALIAFTSGLIACAGLKETLPSAIGRQRKRAEKSLSSCSSSSSEAGSTTNLLSQHDGLEYGSTARPECCNHTAEVNGEDADMKPPPFLDLLTPNVLIALANYSFLAFSDMSSQVLLPLVYSTSIPLGGLGLTPYEIGTTLGIWGVANVIFQLNFLGWLIRKFGPRTMYIISYVNLLITVGAYPVMAFLVGRAGRVDGAVWAVIVIQLSAQTMIYMAYGSMQIIIVNAALNRAALGATNGLAQSAACITRSIAPSFASSLFSISLQHQLLGGNLVYLVLLSIICMGIRLSFLLPKVA